MSDIVMTPPADLAARIEIYLSDMPSDGQHSDAAGANCWELLKEAMNELRASLQPATASGGDAVADRTTFTIPPGHEAVRDAEGRATGEVRPVLHAQAGDASEFEDLRKANQILHGLITNRDAEIERLRDVARSSAGSITPVCCYCDAALSCACCGREQPADDAQGSAEPLSALAGMFSESAHETWTKDEIVNIIEDAIKLGSSHSRPPSHSHLSAPGDRK